MEYTIKMDDKSDDDSANDKNNPWLYLSQGFITGDPGQIRTADPALRRRVLYPAELRNHVKLVIL